MFFKIDFHKKSAKTPVLESLLNNVAGFFLKKTPTQLFSCEYSEMIKKSFFHWTPLVATSVYRWKILQKYTAFDDVSLEQQIKTILLCSYG